MKQQKIKRYRLGVSRTFPKTHPMAGEKTYFAEKIFNSIRPCGLISRFEVEEYNLDLSNTDCKLHTIRSNYDLWAKRMEEVQAGRAVIELYYWSGKPYNSKQVVFATLDKDSGCGVQKLYFTGKDLDGEIAICPDKDVFHSYTISNLAANDGLTLGQFKDWFKGYDLSKPMAIIHFTSFRY